MERAVVETWRELCCCIAYDHDSKTMLIAAVCVETYSYSLMTSSLVTTCAILKQTAYHQNLIH